MRIAQIAPLAESVPPKLYGGTERVVAWLVDELVSLGHEVTLFASGDSRTRGDLHSVWPRALRLSRPVADPAVATTALLEAIAQRIDDFDVVHSHIDWLHLPLLSRLGVPSLTTMHGRLDLPGLSDVVRRFPAAPFVSSNNQRLPLTGANWRGTVHHGLPADLFRPSYEQGSYLAFLGRLTAEKGPETAIRIARAAGMQLRIAAKLPRDERRYFKERLEPQIDGTQIRLIGEVNEEAKQSFLAEAAALLFPIDWPEPFGLVMIEAMACGTPIIAFPAGSVPEVIDQGVTGFVVDDEAQAIKAVQRLREIDRRSVRERFEKRFTAITSRSTNRWRTVAPPKTADCLRETKPPLLSDGVRVAPGSINSAFRCLEGREPANHTWRLRVQTMFSFHEHGVPFTAASVLMRLGSLIRR